MFTKLRHIVIVACALASMAVGLQVMAHAYAGDTGSTFAASANDLQDLTLQALEDDAATPAESGASFDHDLITAKSTSARLSPGAVRTATGPARVSNDASGTLDGPDRPPRA